MPVIESLIVDIEGRFNRTAIDQAKASIEALDKSILKLETDVKKVDKASTEFVKLSGEIKKLKVQRQELDEVLKKGEKGIEEAGKGMGRFANAAKLAKGALAGIGLAAAAGFFATIVKGSISAAIEAEKLVSSFRALGLTQERAIALAKRLGDLKNISPIDNAQVDDAALALARFNISADEIPETLKQLTAVAAGAGQSVSNLADIYGRAKQTGTVFARDFLKIYREIPGITEAIADKTGLSTIEVEKLGRKGKISYEQLRQAIEDTTTDTGKYSTVIEQYGNTVEGALKKFRGTINGLREAVGAGIIGSGASEINQFAATLKTLEPLAAFVGKSIRFLAEGLVGAIVGPDTVVRAEAKARWDQYILDLKVKGNEAAQAAADASRKVVPQKPIETPEERAERERREREYKRALEEAARAEKEFIKQVQEVTFSAEQAQLIREGLDNIAKQRELIRETTQKIDQLREANIKYQDSAKAAGRAVSSVLIAQTEAAIDELSYQLDRQLKTLARDEATRPVVEIPFGVKYVAERKEKIKVEHEKLVNYFAELFQEAVKKDPPIIPTVKIPLPKYVPVEDREAKRRSAIGIIGRLIEDIESPEVQDSLKKFAQTAIDASNAFINAELDKTDFLIGETQSRINRLLSIQEGGNASQIALEQKRLDALNEQRRRDLERQKAITSAQLLANNALTISESIKAVATAFGKGNVVTGIAASLALAATIAATIAAMNAQLNGLPKFWEGAERVSDKSRAVHGGRDGHLIWADGRERILSASQNAKIPEYVKNRDIPGLVTLGLIQLKGGQSGMTDKNIIREQRETNRLLKSNQKLMRKQQININFSDKGTEDIRLRRMAL